MRKIIIQEFVSLDGILQAPGGPEEDTTSDFQYGGWTAPYFHSADQEASELMGKWMQSSDLLLGRKTYDIFAGYWPEHAEMWPGINEVTKYVASTTLNTSEWQNTVFLIDIDAIKELKNSDGGDIQVIGSGDLVQTLLKHDLVDEMRLMIFPITLGSGKRLFGDGTIAAAFEPLESLIATNGVIYTSYKRTGAVETGSVG